MRLRRAAVLLATPALLACAAASPTRAEPAGTALPEEAAGAAAAEEGAFGFRVSDGPLEISSDELDAEERGNGRKIVFRKHVEVRQGELRVSCDRLEALYPPGSKQPHRLRAVGNVLIAQGSQRVWCNEAVYDRAGERLVCRGDGRFEDGGNELRGREIDIDLAAETVRVRGDARVVIHDDGPEPPAAATP